MTSAQVKITFKIPDALLNKVRVDLRRRHQFAHERVGFLSCRPSRTASGGLVILASSYFPVADNHYLRGYAAGAMINSDALRAALQAALTGKASMFHVHMHDVRGVPVFSPFDRKENARFIPDFFNVMPDLPHGALLLSENTATGMCWVSKGTSPQAVNEVVVVGAPLRFFRWPR